MIHENNVTTLNGLKISNVAKQDYDGANSINNDTGEQGEGNQVTAD